MNNRLLEILQNPDLLVLKDIEILEKEISKAPFVQSYRAVQLLATHLFKEENYAAKLSETAAFTTDKKILYQLIHRKEIEKKTEETLEISKVENTSVAQTELVEEPISKVEKLAAIPEAKFQEIELEKIDLPAKIYVEGELNRILFEGEENFLNEEPQEIDLDATKEAGVIVTNQKNKVVEQIDQKFTPEIIINEENIAVEETVVDKSADLSFHGIDDNIEPVQNLKTEDTVSAESENRAEELTEATRPFTKETIINEAQIRSEEDIVESGPELSFHGSQEFLPDVKIETKNDAAHHFVAENKMKKHEAEMQKLIAEVEAKMKKSAAKKMQPEAEINDNHNVNFTGISHEVETPKEEIVEESKTTRDLKNESPETNSFWKPMDLSGRKSTFRNNNITENESQDLTESKTEEKFEETVEEKPVEPQQEIEVEKDAEPEEDIKEIASEIEEIPAPKEESNIPVFFNTWQSWLKLNPESSVLKEDTKQKAIESFIEKEPKISKLKEESSFIFKDKGDNISHLMTETLANLYLDQKLYSKAQKAFELLVEKEPKKADKFKKRLQEIKEMRNQK